MRKILLCVSFVLLLFLHSCTAPVKTAISAPPDAAASAGIRAFDTFPVISFANLTVAAVDATEDEITETAVQTAAPYADSDDVQAVAADVQDDKTEYYVLNKRSKKIHLPHCPSVKTIAEKNYAVTDSYTDAVADGFVPCKRCNP